MVLAQQLEGRSLVIAPPHLLDKDNRGSWPNVFGDFRVPQTDFESSGNLESLLGRDVTKYANVFIDESHRFRTANPSRDQLEGRSRRHGRAVPRRMQTATGQPSHSC